MNIKVGVDIVHIPKLEKLMQNEQAIKNTFHASEIKRYTPEHLAGVFAAKEAFFKAIGKKIGWLSIEVKTQESGRPVIELLEDLKSTLQVKNIDLSISHDHEYAIAQVIVEQ